MANHKSALKRARQNENRRLRNRAVKTRVKSVVKIIRQAADESETETLKKTLVTAQAAIDKAAKKGVLHKRTAARKVSRLSKLANSVTA
ncbi:MAG: 30S ribosomal protein S20 [Desulfobacteraceae bacterium]|nr:30S ribosomal protein S20 [Desulfobacteraceae bacterium]